MSDSYNPLIPGIGGNLINNAFKDKGSSGGSPAVATTPATLPYSTPSNLFEPYQKYIPEAMNSNAQITDSSAILRAYSQNLPEFRAAAQPSQTPPISQSLGSRQQKGK